MGQEEKKQCRARKNKIKEYVNEGTRKREEEVEDYDDMIIRMWSMKPSDISVITIQSKPNKSFKLLKTYFLHIQCENRASPFISVMSLFVGLNKCFAKCMYKRTPSKVQYYFSPC